MRGASCMVGWLIFEPSCLVGKYAVATNPDICGLLTCQTVEAQGT